MVANLKMYWTPDKIMSYNCCFNIVESLRGGGKTVGILTKVLNDYLKRGSEFIYFRRFEKDLELVQKVMFDDLVKLKVPEADKIRLEGKYIVYNSKGLNDNKKWDVKFDEIMGVCLSFADFSRLKSMPMPRARTFIFEEYIPEDGRYTGNEIFKLMGMYESIDRSEDRLNMFLLGNHISDNNPYYEFFGITPQKKSRFTHIKKKSCVIERFKSEQVIDKRMKTRFGKLIANTEYGDFINGISTMDNIEFVKKINEPNMTEFINVNNHGIFYVSANRMYVRVKPHSGKNYTISVKEDEITLPIKIRKHIEDFIMRGNLRFENVGLKFELWDAFLTL